MRASKTQNSAKQPVKEVRLTDPARPLDKTDRAILRALQTDGRMQNNELAELVNLSPTACLERVRRLNRDGVIRGYHAELDHAAGDP
jgi:DNA-binding Lrp family transcriptional regulator